MYKGKGKKECVLITKIFLAVRDKTDFKYFSISYDQMFSF